ncbi:hypothetical protein Emag_002486 [Eimeria magna]
MKNPGDARLFPSEQTEGIDAAAGFSLISQHEGSRAAAAGEGDPYIKAGKTTRPAFSGRLALGALAAVALVVLATVTSKKLLSVEKPPPVKALEDVDKEPRAVEEKPEEAPLVETPRGPEEEPQVVVGDPGVPTKPEEEGGQADVEEKVQNLVEWARRIHTNEILSEFEARKIFLSQQLCRRGVQYEIVARFLNLTPAYDPEKTAAELAEGVPKLIEECVPLEEKARSTLNVPGTMESFGDPTHGRVNVMILREFFFTPLWSSLPPGALVLK